VPGTYSKTAKEAGTCDVHNDIQIVNVPNEYHKFLNEK
jgi:hypothetical protein